MREHGRGAVIRGERAATMSSAELKARALDINEELAKEQDAACADLEKQIERMLRHNEHVEVVRKHEV